MKYSILLFAMIISQNTHSQTFGLTVTVTNIKYIKGEIKLAIYNDSNSFLKKGQEFRKYTFKIAQSTEKYIIPDLPKGEYAIALYHDQNSDGKCNTNFLGVPKEDYGFSNNYKPFLASPSFSNCKFAINDSMTLTIALIN